MSSVDPLLIIITSATVACLLGFYAGWRLRARSLHRWEAEKEIESSAQALELLETRQLLRKVSGHLKNSSKKDNLIRHLRDKHKRLQQELEQHVHQAKSQEKAHYIQFAKLNLALSEARSRQQNVPPPEGTTWVASMDPSSDPDKILTFMDSDDEADNVSDNLDDSNQSSPKRSRVSRVQPVSDRQIAHLANQSE